MLVLLPQVPTFAVAAIFLLWSAYQRRRQRRRVLCERVAYMLWTAAQPLEPAEARDTVVEVGAS